MKAARNQTVDVSFVSSLGLLVGREVVGREVTAALLGLGISCLLLGVARPSAYRASVKGC
jgi:hypothetical protein